MYSTKHTLECSVIVLRVLGKPFVGEERRRDQELCVGLDRSLLEVVGVGLITCGEGELVGGAHTLVWRRVQVYYELQVLEEEEKVREEVQEIERESQVEEKRSDDHAHVDGVKDSLPQPRCVCR